MPENQVKEGKEPQPVDSFSLAPKRERRRAPKKDRRKYPRTGEGKMIIPPELAGEQPHDWK